MKHFFNPLFGGLMVILYSSCQKEASPVIDNPTVNDSTKLSTLTLLHTVSGVTDTIFASFEYDAQKRLVSIKTVH